MPTAIETHLVSGYPCPRACAPFRDEEAQCVACAEGHASQEGPLLADEPFIVLDVVCIGQERIERQEGDRVEVPPEGYARMQTGAGNLDGVDRDGSPG